MEHAVEVEGAVVLLGRFPALAGLDLTLEAGSVTLIQGPNGAGKTTLLKLLAALVRPARGSARVLGHDVVDERRQVRSSVGLLGASTMLYDQLTIRENLAFWAGLAGHHDAAIDQILDRMGIADIADQLVASLSTGQLRRSALSVVAVRRPRLWLLDEPHAGLDQSGRDAVDGLIGDAIAAGATVVVASHELDRVRPLADQVITIAGGSVHAVEAVGAQGAHRA